MDLPQSAKNKSDESVYSKITTCFRTEVLKEAMKTQFSNPKMKISEEVLSLINEISKAIVVEAAIRASKQASAVGKKKVQLEHVEAILPQMILDLP